jgi:cytochrome c oxidase cbb3-type subunit 2
MKTILAAGTKNIPNHGRHLSRLAAHAALAAVLALSFAAGAARAADDDAQARLARMRQDAQSTGKAVYDAACATCHGRQGDGAGREAVRFAQRPTDFTKGVYKLRSTIGKVPQPGDLERSIREGMPGTEMVPFRGVLSEAGIAAVAAYLRSLAPPPAADAIADSEKKRVTAPAQRPFPRSADTVAKGKALYAERCLECHGERGEGTATEKDDAGYRVVMMDFRRGFFKAGTSDQDLYRAILSGMNGTSMGNYGGDISETDAWNVLDYIRSLAPERGVLGRITLYVFQRPSGFNYGAY